MKSCPFLSPALNTLLECLIFYKHYRTITTPFAKLLFSLQIYFSVTIFVYKLPYPLTWTSVLHLKLLSPHTLLPAIVSSGAHTTAVRLTFSWFCSLTLLSGFQSPLEWCLFSPEEIGTLFWYTYLLHTPFKTIVAIIHLERVGEDFQWPKTMKMINPLLPVQRDPQTAPAKGSYLRSERRPDLVRKLRERFTTAFLSLQAIFCNCCISWRNHQRS